MLDALFTSPNMEMEIDDGCSAFLGANLKKMEIELKMKMVGVALRLNL